MGLQSQPKNLDSGDIHSPQQSYTSMSWSVALSKTSQIRYSDRSQVFNTHPNAAVISGAVGHLPLNIQVAFRRKLLAIFALQLLFVTAAAAAFEWIPSLKSAWRSTLVGHEGYIVIPSIAILAFLLALYKVRTKFPWNWVCLALFSVALALVFAGLGAIFDTAVGVINCGALIVWTLVMIVLSGVRVKGLDEPKLLSPYVSGGIGFAVVAAGVGVLYGIFMDDFVTQLGLALTLALQLVMAIWFAHDAKKMFEVLTPDEYMQGIIYFYADIMLLLLVAVAATAGGGATSDTAIVGTMALTQANDNTSDEA